MNGTRTAGSHSRPRHRTAGELGEVIRAFATYNAGRLPRWLSTRHRLRSEAAAVLILYGLYELARGLVVSDAHEADHHAREVVALERSLHLFREANVQHAAGVLPALTGLLGTAYLTLHLAVTGAVLLWLHRRRPDAFAFVRTTLLVASALSLVGFLAFPTAPPRLAGVGIADTVSNRHIDLDKGLVSSLYNPYAAVPSMHIGYALIVAAGLLLYARRPLVRAAGALYPPFVLLVVVATGNHFFFDAAAGAIVAVVAAAAAAPLTRRAAPGRVRELGCPLERRPFVAWKKPTFKEAPMRANIAPDSERRRWLVLAVTVAAQFMVIVDVAVVNVALPAIKHDLHFSQEGLQWVITAYSILFGGVLLLGGRLADLLGRRRLFVTGVAVFTLGSLLSGLAWSEGALIVTRALQGLGGGLLAPAALSIVVTTFSEGRERNIALGVWGAASGSGGAVGVLLGGVLTSYLSWSWIFFVNLPVGAAVLAVTPWLVSESRAALAHRHFDVSGATSITAGLMVLVYAITRTSAHGWSDGVTVGLLATAAALIAAFVAIEARSPAPLLPLRIFRLRTLSAANVAMLTIGATAFAQFFLMTLYLQEVLRYSAIETGVAFIAITVTIVVVSNFGQALTTRLGARPVLSTGLLLSAAGAVLYAQLPAGGRYFWNVFPALVVSGIGLALSFVPVTIAGLTGVQPADAGVASGLINTSRQIGGSVGLAAVTTIAATATSHYAESHAVLAVSGPALTHGFQVAFYTLAGLALAGAAIAAAFVESKPKAASKADAVEAELLLEEAA